MANKYRPERIELKAPPEVADEIEEELKEHLHKRAKLERDNKGERVVFSFWPTKSEYFMVTIILIGMEHQYKQKAI